MLYRVLAILVFLYAPLHVFADDTLTRANCANFHGEVDARDDLTADEKREWKASPDIWRSFLWENDGYAGGGDYHYTNGMKLSWLYNPCRGKLQMVESLWRRLLKHDSEDRFYTGGAFGMNMYTPRKVEEDFRQRFDRPFVGWLYGALLVQRQDRPSKDEQTERRTNKGWGTGVDAFELQVGVVGPSAGQEPIQQWWHRIGFGSTNPNWEFQVPNHLGVNGVYVKSRHYWFDDRHRWRGTAFGGGAFGNVASYVNAGAVLAFGNPGEGFVATSTISPSATSPITLMRQEDAELADAKKEGRTAILEREWAFFVGVEHRYIGNSVFIEGRGEAEHDITLVRHVYDIFGGFTWQFWKSHSLAYKRLRRSVEFHSPVPFVAGPRTIGQFTYELRF